MRLQSWDEPVAPTDLLVSTVNAGAADARAAELAGASAAVFDVIYHPWPTPLAQAAVARDRLVLNGLDLLVHQALLQIELMTESTVPADAAVPRRSRRAGRRLSTARLGAPPVEHWRACSDG